MKLEKRSLGWLYGNHWPHTITLIVVFVGLGHSVLAMSGEESLAQVYREIEHPKLQNLKKAGTGHFHLQHGVHLAGFVLRRDDHPRQTCAAIFPKT